MYWKTSAPTECVTRHNRTLLFQRYKSEGMLQYSEAVAKCHIQATIFFNFSVFFLKMLCKHRYWWWLMFLFLESLLVFPDLSFPLEYWICNYKKYMEQALCTRSDSVESGHTSDGSPMFERRRLAVYWK